MIDCMELQAKMPEWHRTGRDWEPAEAEHLAGCDDCRAAWCVVQLGSALHQDVQVDAEAIASAVLTRLRVAPAPVARLPWRGFGLGLAAAASVALAVWLPSRGHSIAPLHAPPEAMALALPELEGLTDAELQAVLRTMPGAPVADAAGGVPRLGDLTDDEMAQLLKSVEGS